MNAHSLPPAPVEPPAVVNAAGVARLLGRRTAGSFLNARARLEAQGFPPKLPGINGWSRAAVLRWVATNGATFLPADLDDGLRETGEPGLGPVTLEGEYGQ